MIFQDPIFRHVFFFTYAQAFLSAVASAVLGTAGAILWSESDFPGSRLFWRLSLVCFSLPSILVVLSLIGFWGRSGLLGRFIGDFYGWPAILLANTFFNFPLYLKSVGTALREQGRDEERAALSVGATRWACFWRVTFPKILPEWKSAFCLSFLYSSSASFLVVLCLGGGPRFTTIDTAIYQAVKVDLDLPYAARLALVQMAVSLLLYFLCLGRTRTVSASPGTFTPLYLFRGPLDTWLRLAYALVFFLVVVGPLSILVASGLKGLFSIDPVSIGKEAWIGMKLALLVAAIVVPAALGVAHLERHARRPWLKRSLALLAGAPMSLSTVVLTAALVTAFPSILGAYRGSLLPPAIIQAFVAFPLVYRPLRDGLCRIPDSLHLAAASLGASRWETLKAIELPLLKAPLVLALLFALAYSLGEIGAVLVFLSDATETVPVGIYRLMGQYRFGEAYGAGLCLLVLMAMLYGLAGRLEA